MMWRCGGCKQTYTDLLSLESVKAVESDTDPKKEHGFVSKCSCGYVFFKDKWFLKDTFDIFDEKGKVAQVEVSTVDLELEHFGFWYETMVFIKDVYIDKNLECNYQDRYKTKEEAIKFHDKVVQRLRAGKFELFPKEYELELKGEDE